MQFIDIGKQYRNYKTEIDKQIQEVLDSGQFILGSKVTEVEEKLAEYVGVRHCITVASGTDSLLMVLMALGIGPGDEVITTPFTFIATAEVIALLGAKPVFIDIEPKSFNLDLSQLEAAITAKTRAIIPVSLFGQMPDFKEINAIADRYGLPVIEDAAQSFGATQRGRKSCSVSHVASTSFFPAKPLGCFGDGGALFTNDDILARQLKAIRNHGSEERNHHPMLGINGRFDSMQAAVILAKLPHYPQEVEARGRIGARYSEALAEACEVPHIQEGNTHVYAQYTIRVGNRAEMQEFLKERGIPSAAYYPKCLHLQPVFAGLGYAEGSFPVAEKAAGEVLSLPMHPFLTEAEQDLVIDAVKECRMVPV